VDVDLEIVAAAEDVLAEVVLSPSLRDRTLEDLGFAHELTANVDVRRVSGYGVRRDRNAFENHVGVDEDQLAILEGPRLRLVGVADHVLGFGQIFRNEAPLDAGRETRASPATHPGRLDLFDDLRRVHRHGLGESVVAAAIEIGSESPGVLDPPRREKNRFHRHPSSPSRISSRLSAVKSV